jgi:hypothetical protein
MNNEYLLVENNFSNREFGLQEELIAMTKRQVILNGILKCLIVEFFFVKSVRKFYIYFNLILTNI